MDPKIFNLNDAAPYPPKPNHTQSSMAQNAKFPLQILSEQPLGWLNIAKFLSKFELATTKTLKFQVTNTAN